MDDLSRITYTTCKNNALIAPAHAGCDFEIQNIQFRFMILQSTHPRRVRYDRRGLFDTNNYFNPRTHAGCDRIIHSTRIWTVSNATSIHAPTQGAIVSSYATGNRDITSIHAGCDNYESRNC